MSNKEILSVKPSTLLKTITILVEMVETHVEFARSLHCESAVMNDATTYRLTEAWTFINTILTLNRNHMRNARTLSDQNQYLKQSSLIQKYALELLELGNAWRWPRWAGGFEYIDSALRTSRLVFLEPNPDIARILVTWLVRQAIYHDDTDDSRLTGIVEVLHWGDLFGRPKYQQLPEEDVPLVYWILARLYGNKSTEMHRILHGDDWCSWKGLVIDRNNPLNLSPLNELFDSEHPILNPSGQRYSLNLPNNLVGSDKN